MTRKFTLLYILFLFSAGSGLIAQVPKPSTPLEKFIYENTVDIKNDPIRVCQTLDSVYQLVEKDPKILKDKSFQQLLKSGRTGACFNAIKPLSEIDQGPSIVINHCIKVKKILFETEEDTSTLVRGLLYLNSILALNYERNQEYKKAVELKQEFTVFERQINDELYFEYVRFLNTLLTSYKELALFEEAFDIALTSHIYLEEVLKNNKSIPTDLEILIKRMDLSLLVNLGGVKEADGDLVLAKFFYEVCRDKAFEWDMISLDHFVNYITFLGNVGDYEEQDRIIARLEERILEKSSVRSVEYVGLLTSKAMMLLKVGDYTRAMDITEQSLAISKEIEVPFFMLESIKQTQISVLEELGDGERLEKVYRSLIDDHKAYYGKSRRLIPLLNGFGLMRQISREKRIDALTEAENIAIEYKDTLSLVDIYSKLQLIATDLYLEKKYNNANDNRPENLLRDLSERILLCLKTPTLAKSDNLVRYSLSAASTYIILKEYKKALSIAKPLTAKISDLSFDDRIDLLHDLADFYERTGHIDSTILYAGRLSAELKNNITDLNFQLVESGFENYDQVNRYFEYIDRIVNRRGEEKGPMVQLLADNALFRKSIYLNSSTQAIKATDSITRKQILIKSKNDLFKSVSWQSIQKKLSSKSAVVEFVSYSYDSGVSFFYAIIIKPFGDPILISYPQNDALFNLLDRFDGEQAAVAKLYGNNRVGSLYPLLWGPLSKHLIDIEEVFISPDGLLHKVNFSAITGPDRNLLGQNLRIRRILSSRFLEETDKQMPIAHVSLFGGIDYEADSTITLRPQKDSIKPLLIRSTRGDKVTWNYLDGTQLECQKIQQICRSNRLDIQFFQGKEATEEAFYKQAAFAEGYILHVATHGFTDLNMFRQNRESRGLIIDKEAKKTTSDPLLRTGIVFAGANRDRKYPAVSPTDGIALGAEIAKQPFDNCELVVLSACETGLGEVKGKEGVFGLQKAFKQSGVNKIIASLWQVPDKQTAELFTLFYKNLFILESASQALQTAQSAMRKKYAPYYWAGFILLE
jgi:CHAT domain-containing protein